MVGTYLKMFRAVCGKQSSEVADVLGCSLSYYSLVEHGHREPSRRTLHQWASRLGISACAMDFLALDAPPELDADEVATFGNIKAAMVNKLVFQFMGREPCMAPPIKEVDC
jgi:transcriptional regulator with XRE-family HTH domain